MDKNEVVVRSYSDKAYRGNLGGPQVELPPGDYAVADLRRLSEVFESVAIRMMERRGTLAYHPGHE